MRAQLLRCRLKAVSDDLSQLITLQHAQNGVRNPFTQALLEQGVDITRFIHGKQVVIHTVITGGQAIRDTLAGFASLVEQMPEETRIVVWLNEFFGDIEAEGKTFEEMKVYQNNRDRVHGLVRIARQTGSTFGKDVQLMLDSKLTFDEVAASPDFGLMAKSRLAQVKKAIFEQLAAVI